MAPASAFHPAITLASLVLLPPLPEAGGLFRPQLEYEEKGRQTNLRHGYSPALGTYLLNAGPCETAMRNHVHRS
jgi:hypothetical protein